MYRIYDNTDWFYYNQEAFTVPFWYYINALEPSPFPYYSSAYRQFPPINPNRFQNSASKTSDQLKDAKKILDRISSSQEYAHKIMDAAQSSKKEDVERLLYSAGIQHTPQVSFNPNGIRMTFMDKKPVAECCKIQISVRWS